MAWKIDERKRGRIDEPYADESRRTSSVFWQGAEFIFTSMQKRERENNGRQQQPFGTSGKQ